MDYTDIYDRWGNYIPLDLRDQFLKECLAKQEQLEKEREDYRNKSQAYVTLIDKYKKHFKDEHEI